MRIFPMLAMLLVANMLLLSCGDKTKKAAVDAGTGTDGGQDGCSVFVTPPSGTVSTIYEITFAHSGTECSWGLDGLFQGSTDCEGISQTTLPIGTHTVSLAGTGDSGSLDCISNIVSVTEEAPPTCGITLTPTTGSEFSVAYTSDGTSCSWTLDGVNQGQVDCSSMGTVTLGAGQHAAAMTATSASGTSTCTSNVVTVSGAGAPTCSVTIGPENGTVSTSFSVDYTSNANTCSWALDGVPQGNVACSGTQSLMMPPGVHSIALTAVGSGGTSICNSNSVSVEADGNTQLPTCSASIGPETGSASTSFDLNYSSNGSSCTLMVDGVSQGTVPCIGLTMRNFLPGDHSISLITTGEGGTTSCQSNTVSVSGDSAPTCSVSIGPSTGTTSTSFLSTWSSDAALCSWSIDGINQGSINCNSTDSRTYTPGEHTVTVTATSPGGTSVCTSNAITVEGAGAPSCSIAVSPASGDTNTVFDMTTTSDATSCTWRLGFINQGSIECAGVLNASLSVGTHTVALVATGPGGTSTCSAPAVTVVEAEVEAPIPTCTVALSPSTGDTETLFTTTWSSTDATDCSWTLDGVEQGVIACSGMQSTMYETGSHSASFTATGPGGTATCNSNVVVVSAAPNVPVCTVFISPATGDTNTQFGITWSSENAESCVWLLDGVEQGTIECNGSLESVMPLGTHSVGLAMTGATDNGSCTSNTIVVTNPVPTCTASISPNSGDTDTPFEIIWDSTDATSCTWALDGVNQGAIECSGTVTGPLVAGNHTVTLIPTGPGGTGSCTSNTVSVSAATPAPTCTVSVSPGSGNTTTNFTVTWSSDDATSCTWELDGVNQGAIACDGSNVGPLPEGEHNVSLRMTGPGGTGSCTSNTVSVSPPAPTCTTSISPTSGDTNTNFTVAWSSSNTTSCTWDLDGVNQGAIACSGPSVGPLPLGNHNVTLRMTGPGGTGSCTSNTVSVSVPAPTCTVSLSPGSGTTATNFTATWSSDDATSCTWSLDGVNQGAIDCNGSVSSPLPPGNHNVSLSMTGTGGTGSCTSNTVSVN